jgi:hypothetical protein
MNQISSTKKAKPRIASKNAHLTKAHRDNTVDATISIGYFPKNSTTPQSDTTTSISSDKSYARKNSVEARLKLRVSFTTSGIT